MAFKADESTGPYFSNGPASFKIVNASEGIANNKHRNIYLKFEFEVTDQEGKKGKLTEFIFSNATKKYNSFLQSIDRQELEKDSVPSSVFIGQKGLCKLSVNEGGYSCIDSYIYNDSKDGNKNDISDKKVDPVSLSSNEETYDDDIPF